MMNTHKQTARRTSSSALSSPRRLIAAGTALLIGVAALAACTSAVDDAATTDTTDTTDSADTAAEAGPVVLLGDSVAAGEAVALAAALEHSGIAFTDATSTGGGNVVGPNAEAQWEELPGRISSASGGYVVYQITTYDWGTPEEAREAYERLASDVEEVEAELLLVSMPPIDPDDFYEPHMEELENADAAARALAEDAEGVEFLDAAQVWGQEYARSHEGAVDRSDDGIHVCPQGAARFANWLLAELAEVDPAVAPADPESWANEGWSGSEEFVGC